MRDEGYPKLVEIRIQHWMALNLRALSITFKIQRYQRKTIPRTNFGFKLYGHWSFFGISEVLPAESVSLTHVLETKNAESPNE